MNSTTPIVGDEFDENIHKEHLTHNNLHYIVV